MYRALPKPFIMTVLLCANTIAPAVEVLPPELLEKYESSIKRLSREVNAAQKHRTAIIGRMDDITRQQADLDSEMKQVINRQPKLRDGIAQIDQHINRLSERIVDTGNALEFISNQLKNLPSSSLWEDALGRSPQKRRLRAVKEYQQFKAQALLTGLRREQQDLIANRSSLFDSFEGINGSVDSLTSKHESLKEKRRSLETQFVDLSAQIVQKLDRRTQLESRLADIQHSPELAVFSNARGLLPLPTQGTLKHEYAESKAQGLLQWEGIVIDAPIGQEVQVVFDGNVVFADHMQGLGNVAIVDHGGGFMSLYGMTDFLIVEPGQTLLAGDTIGTVGTGIGDDTSSLYFEIRQDADTVNPAEWLKSHSISADPGS